MLTPTQLSALTNDERGAVFRHAVAEIWGDEKSKTAAACAALQISIGTYKRWQNGLAPVFALILMQHMVERRRLTDLTRQMRRAAKDLSATADSLEAAPARTAPASS